MRSEYIKTSIIASVFVMGMAMSNPQPALSFTNMSGSWTAYPAADIYNQFPAEQLSKAVSTPRYNYFVVRGRAYKKNKYSINTIDLDLGREFNALYRYDMKHPEKGVYSANTELSMSRNLLQTIQYSPAAGALVIAYDDATLDVVYDDEKIITIDNLAVLPLPTNNRINSITFTVDGKEFYVCHNMGMMVFETATGKILKNIILNVGPRYAAPIGDKMIWIADDANGTPRLFLLPGNETPESENAVPMDEEYSVSFADGCTSEGRVSAPQVLMPITEKSVIINGQVGTASYCPILLTLDDEGMPELLHLKNLKYTDSKAGTNVYATHLYPIETLTGNYRDGYLLNSQNGILLVKSGVEPDLTAADPALDFCQRACVYIPKSTINSSVGKLTDEEHRMVATWDGETFMSLNTKVGFFTRTITRDASSDWDANVVWSKRSDDIPVVGNSIAIPSTIDYNPLKGMMFSGNQYDVRAVNDTPDQPGNISAFRNDKWEYLDVFPQNYTVGRLTSRTRGLATDPTDNDKYYSSHYYYGLIRRSLSKPEEVVVMGMPGLPLTSLKGYISDAFQDIPTGKYINFTNPAFDADNRMWMTGHYPSGGYDGNLYLTYWDADKRQACEDIYTNHDLLKANGFSHIKLPGKKGVNAQQLLPLKSEGYQTCLVYAPLSYYVTATQPFIIDHRGTLDDTSDDRIVTFSDFRLAGTNGRTTDTYCFTYYVDEDPRRGEVWLMTERGPYYFKLSEVFSDDPVLYSVELDEDGEVEPSFISNFQTMFVKVDPVGRKWFGSPSGLFAISPDNRKLLGFWNKSNSELTDDNVKALGVDPVTNDVWVATYGTLYRFRPSGSEESQQNGVGISAIPEYVTPDFRGEMTFHGLKEGETFRIMNESGEEIATLNSTSGMSASWHPAAVKDLKTGQYRLTDKSGNVVYSFSVMR
ncbi:MAG: hypothetical protein K2N03_01105 [Muribaculaceae bacterium]|nr:hypothetical protein [Muribaculaceae bacterium]